LATMFKKFTMKLASVRFVA